MKKLPNPFKEPFWYNNIEYRVLEDETQGLLYLWFFGLKPPKRIRELFTFRKYGEKTDYHRWCELHRRLQKVEKYGLEEPNFLGQCLLMLVKDCHQDKVLIDNTEQFYTYVRIWLLQHIPALESRLHTIFERINLFF